MLTILFDGISYGMLLFVLAIGLSVTLGLMNFINLAHGVFAMMGGYIIIALMKNAHISFYLALPIVFILVGIVGALAERFLYRPMYKRTHLEQVLFSIGLTFIAVAGTQYFMGPGQYNIHLPLELRGRTIFDSGGMRLGVGHYRLFLIVICAILTLVLQLILSRTRFGSQLRAAVDDPAVASGLGINVNFVFFSTFAFGSGLAGLGGALGIEMMGLDSMFALRYLVYFLMIVAMGGTTSLTGPFIASVLLGIVDQAGKYYFPSFSEISIYLFMLLILLWRPEGLFASKGRLA